MATALVETVTYSEAARRTLRPEDCALAVIDIQEKLLPPIFEKERMVRNSQLLVRLADILSLPILVSTQYVKGLGPTISEITSLLPEVEVVDKLEFGCFGSDQFRASFGCELDAIREMVDSLRADTRVVCDQTQSGGKYRADRTAQIVLLDRAPDGGRLECAWMD